MKMGITAMLVALMALGGCTTASVKARSIGNARAFVINCSGMTSSWESCYGKAETICSTHGYRVISKTTDVKEEPGDGFMGFSPGRDSRTLVVACKLPSET